LTNLEQALDGLKPLITVDAATTTLTYTLSSQAQPVEDLSVVNAAPAKRRGRAKLAAKPKAEKIKAIKPRAKKTKVAAADVAAETVTESVKLPSTGSKLWLKCLGRKKLTVAQITDAALTKLKLEDSAREVITSRAKAWTYAAVKKGLVVIAGTRNGSKLYQAASAKDDDEDQGVQAAGAVEGLAPAEAAAATEVKAKT
jgi:hypothetical protein